MKRKLYIHALLFFTPIVVLFGVIEYLTRQLPSSYSLISKSIDTDASEVEILILGPSQIRQAINPALIKRNTLSMASGSQHHDSDFHILKQMRPRLPQLKTVVLELSYSHLELPHNGPYFWKNSVYLNYYDVNAFDRTTYFKDRLIFLSNPKFFSNQLINHYVKGEDSMRLNRFGFDENNFSGWFRKLKYNKKEIAKRNQFKINTEPNVALFKYNSAYFLTMLDYLQEEELEVIICTIPMYTTYFKQRNPEILHRRDSILDVIQKRYPNVRILDRETDTINFNVKDFTNPSHMNPNGASKFTPILSELLESSN